MIRYPEGSGRRRGWWRGRLLAYPLILVLGVAPAAATRPPAARAELAPVARAEPAPVDAFRWPLDGTPRPVRRFDPPPKPWLPGHRGVDLAASPGAPVRAAGAGVVLFAGQIAGRGVVSVLHRNGLRTTYEPVEPAVRSGDRVRAGDPVGVLVPGHPGCPAEACLHWGLRRDEQYLDPLLLLGLGRVRLLPLDGSTSGQRRAASSAGRRSASRSYSSARL